MLNAVFYFVHSFAFSIEGGSLIVRLVFLDFADNSGSLDCSTFLQILHEKGSDPNVLKALRDYFHNNTQFTSFVEDR